VNQLPTVDVLLFSSHQEYQVRSPTGERDRSARWPNQVTSTSCQVLTSTGNSELLEADITRAKVLPCRGRAQGKAAEQLHQRLLGGECRLIFDE
jgi:hypothetical protein